MWPSTTAWGSRLLPSGTFQRSPQEWEFKVPGRMGIRKEGVDAGWAGPVLTCDQETRAPQVEAAWVQVQEGSAVGFRKQPVGHRRWAEP